jgi:hypothetical protein
MEPKASRAAAPAMAGDSARRFDQRDDRRRLAEQR